MRRGGGSISLIPSTVPSRGLCDFLCSPKESHQRKGLPGSPPLPRKLVAVSPVLLDRPGSLRNSRTNSTLADSSGANFLRFRRRVPNSPSARPKPRADLCCSGGEQGPRKNTEDKLRAFESGALPST